jgi:hypothetical protein
MTLEKNQTEDRMERSKNSSHTNSKRVREGEKGSTEGKGKDGREGGRLV